MFLKSLFCSFFLFGFYSATIGQVNEEKCKIFYEAEALNDTTYGLVIKDKNQNVLFDWPEIIGPVIVRKVDDETIKFYCFANTIKIHKSEVTYKRGLFCKVKFGINTCSVESNITINIKDDTCKVIEKYEYLKANYSGTFNDSVSEKIQLILLQYSFDLMYGALMGSIKCKQLYFAFINDFQYMQFGLNGSDYVSNREIIKRLTIIK